MFKNCKICNELFEIAKKNGVYIFEAITNVHLPNYKIIINTDRYLDTDICRRYYLTRLIHNNVN